MNQISVAEAKAHLSEVLAQVESGREVVVTRRGRPVARMIPVSAPRRCLNLEKLDAFRASLPKAAASSAEIVRRIRDENY